MALLDKVLLKLSPKTVIERSRFFDGDWYKERYGIKADPAKHYLTEGWKKDYDPSSRFSSKDYLINNPDIQGINPLLHYEVFGKNEGRRAFVPRGSSENGFSAETVDLSYERYFEKIAQKKTVSFDVFDTLVIRPFVNAEEIFDHLEKVFGLNGFSKARKKAEAEARRTLNKEVGLDEIYGFLDDPYRSLKDKEIETEISFCHRNPLMVPVYEKAKELNKRMIAVSDMYLSREVVGKILENSGFVMDEIYVSCEYDKTKGSGELYSFVCEKEKTSPDEMVHFGDNYVSDYSEAVNFGIDAFQTPKITDHILSQERYRSYLKYYQRDDSLASSAHIAQISEHFSSEEDEPFFTKIAYALGGPLALSYLSFVCEEAKKDRIDQLLFVSRDGYCLKEVYEKYFFKDCGISCAYAYLSRAAVFSGAFANHLSQDLEKIVSIAKHHLPEIGEENGSAEEIFEKHKETLYLWSKKRSDSLQKHLITITKGHENIATVDMFSGNYTSQKGAAYYLNDKRVTGYYAGNFAAGELRHASFFERFLGMRDNLPVKMSEFLVTSYESPVIGVNKDGGPIYGSDKEHRERYEQIMDGICGYIEDHRRFFDEKNCLLSPEEWIDLSDEYLKNCPQEDIDMLSQVVDSQNPVAKESDPSFDMLIRDYREKGY
ncbi:MAG: hypothetical protein K5648_04785 [Erysipelotrichaceae bacterium]|nr:hypothetical protein [Erysipelotrichaceae bacterium]